MSKTTTAKKIAEFQKWIDYGIAAGLIVKNSVDSISPLLEKGNTTLDLSNANINIEEIKKYIDLTVSILAVLKTSSESISKLLNKE